MDEALFLTIFQKAIMLIMIIGAPILLSAIVVGLAISIIQSVTQIQEQTLTFVPKIFAGIIILIITMPWMIATFVSVVNEMFEYIPAFIAS